MTYSNNTLPLSKNKHSHLTMLNQKSDAALAVARKPAVEDPPPTPRCGVDQNSLSGIILGKNQRREYNHSVNDGTSVYLLSECDKGESAHCHQGIHIQCAACLEKAEKMPGKVLHKSASAMPRCRDNLLPSPPAVDNVGGFRLSGSSKQKAKKLRSASTISVNILRKHSDNRGMLMPEQMLKSKRSASAADIGANVAPDYTQTTGFCSKSADAYRYLCGVNEGAEAHHQSLGGARKKSLSSSLYALFSRNKNYSGSAAAAGRQNSLLLPAATMKSPIALYTDVEITPLPDYRASLNEANNEDDVFCEEVRLGVRLTSLTAEQVDMCSITSYSDSDYEAAIVEYRSGGYLKGLVYSIHIILGKVFIPFLNCALRLSS